MTAGAFFGAAADASSSARRSMVRADQLPRRPCVTGRVQSFGPLALDPLEPGLGDTPHIPDNSPLRGQLLKIDRFQGFTEPDARAARQPRE